MVEIELSITGTWLKDLPMKSPARCSTSSLASSISWSAHLLLFFIFSDFKFSWVSSWWVVSSGNSHYFSRVDTCWFPVLKLKKKNNPQKTKPNPQNTPKKPTKNLKQNQPTKKPPPQTLKNSHGGISCLIVRREEKMWTKSRGWLTSNSLPKSTWRKTTVLHILRNLEHGKELLSDFGIWVTKQSKLSSVL